MSRRSPVAPVAAVALAALVVAGGCAGAGPGEADVALKAAAAQLAGVRSGTLQFRLVAGPAVGGDEPPQAAFELAGPFSLAEPGGLPVVDLEFTRVAGESRTITQLISNGSRAFEVLDGTPYQLGFEETERLRAPRQFRGDEGFAGLRVDRWARDPRLEPGDAAEAGEAGEGAPTQRMTGDVDVVRALNDVFTFAANLGAADMARPQITGEVADALRRLTESATLELVVGADDRHVRGLSVHIRLRTPLPEPVRAALGPLGAASVRLFLAVEEPNTPVTVAAPEAPRPASERPRPAGS